MAIKGIIFDMDGTLIDSRLDFDQMRVDLGLPVEAPILETIESYTGDRRLECERILRRHEQRGVQLATVFPGHSRISASCRCSRIKDGNRHWESA